MSQFKSPLEYLLLLAMAGTIVGCGHGTNDSFLSAKVGAKCEVLYRHDALGMAAALPAGPQATNLNGAEMSVIGTIVRQNAEWLVVTDMQQHELYIPKSVILSIVFEQPTPR